MKSKLIIFIIVAALAAVITGCGSKGADYPSSSELSEATPTGDTGDTSDTEDKSSGKPGKPPKVSGKYDEKPDIADTSGDPPTKLVIKDLKTGSGKAAANGDNVTVNYVGRNWSNNQEFDTSFGKDPFTFVLGQGNVIQGWDKGVKGMKVGGRRLLVIPPDLGYGSAGQGASIPPDETLVFVVDLKKVEKG